ncbi:hypothetical protein KRP22_012044 [Phytophthora ramorum]|uniref:uncharacterized protein n=1 Tax=Phytophthora ramorum TaxID=164328 RepID=UPI0030AD6E7E|nr:hypothetical protein KRP23_10876 [Phytophthora ramorum]KAH7498742.1 hypothetical protein KRP22_11882 [Phytophthora ramorum]
MEDESDVFQDFGSDASDFDDDVDWNFTDGESASILQLMGEANSTKSGGTDAIPLSTAAKDHPTAPKAIDPYSAKVEEVSTSGYSDEELLDELYPESKLQVIAEVVKTAELQNDENRSRSTECEVEWALMALEEQEQLKHQSRSASPTHGDADFVSLFEEMYGGETVIALSTPSPTAQVNPHKSGLKDFASRRADEQIVVKQDDACSSTKADNSIPGNVPADLFDMLKLIYTKTTEVQQDLPSLLYAAGRMLCLVDHDGKAQKFESISSLNSLTKAVCSLEELLYDQDFVNSFAPTREERLELVIVALDNKVGALPHSLTIKWSKTIDMLPLLAKMREQTRPPVPAPSPTHDQPTDLQIDTKVLPPVQPEEKKRSPLQGWATFHPEKMPARRCESMKVSNQSSKSKQPGQSSSSKKPRVRIRQYIPSKLRVRCKMYNPEDSELTFRPKINRKSPHHGKSDSNHNKEDFTTRMQQDISHRLSQKLQYEQEREQHDQKEAESVSSVKLIAKGSERILLKNGMWAESLDERIHRLAQHRTNTEVSDSRSKRRRQRQQQRKREAAAVVSRACESLYQRGIEQRRREQERLQEDVHDLEFQRNRPKISSRSLRVMKTRIRQELAQLCADSKRTANAGASVDGDSLFVTFIQFSCALLYFGFVPDLNTPWESSASGDNDSEITLLWHSWTAFTRDDTGAPGSKLAVKVLERVLFSVILGGRTGEPSSLQTREVQMLLRMYRANYYSRKHTQLKSHQNDSKAGQKWAKECQTSQRSSSRRQRIRYSLHGKPIRNNGTPETDFLSEREQLLQEKIDEMRDAKVKQELEGCTFHPCINPVPSEVAALRSARQSSPSATVSTFERLYSDAFQRQNNVVEKYLEAKLHREELEKQESRVHPSYVNGLTIEERLENLHVALAGNALPVDFHKKIDAMRTATEIKALDEQMKERRLQPAQFKKANDGRTIVLPFQFATEIRASLSTELKQQRTKTAHRPRDHVMKGLRPPTEGKEREVPTPVHPRAKIHENVDSSDYQEADLCLDVHLSPSETHQLYLNIHDDPHEVVKRFARHFSLTNTQRHFLVQLVETRLEQFTNLQV